MRVAALVTGANRGIGREVVRQLAARGWSVWLTARSAAKAEIAAAELKSERVIPAQLDITSPESIVSLRERLQREAGRLDVLINNAAINYDTWQRAISADLEEVKATLDTNLFGAWRLTQVLLPLLRQSAAPRIVNVSSGSGSLHDMGGGTPAYSVSKTALNALTRMLAAELRLERILVNAVCPGWVATDMGGSGGRPVEDGAAGIVWAATLPNDGPSGGFFRDEKPVPW